jgi:hypothetical protein
MVAKWHYVYYSYEPWGRGYIGKRSSAVPPEDDTSYLGSYTDQTFKPTCKIILEVFETDQEALEAEVKLHQYYEVDVNPHFANKAKQTTSKFAWRGNTTEKLSLKQKANRKQKWIKSLCAGSRGHFYHFTSPSGSIHVTLNLREFCKEHNINRAHVYDVINGRLKQIKGWKVSKHVMP